MVDSQGEIKELRQQLATVAQERDDLEDCREALRELGRICGCDHCASKDDLAMKVAHIQQAVYSRENYWRKLHATVSQANDKLEAALNLVKIYYGLPVPADKQRWLALQASAGCDEPNPDGTIHVLLAAINSALATRPRPPDAHGRDSA